MNASFEKVIRGGKVAVLYSPGYGAGWYTWNSPENIGLIFDSELVAAVESKDNAKAAGIAETKYPGGYYGGSDQLEIEWVMQGDRFRIEEYDGSESVVIIGPDTCLTA